MLEYLKSFAYNNLKLEIIWIHSLTDTGYSWIYRRILTDTGYVHLRVHRRVHSRIHRRILTDTQYHGYTVGYRILTVTQTDTDRYTDGYRILTDTQDDQEHEIDHQLAQRGPDHDLSVIGVGHLACGPHA